MMRRISAGATGIRLCWAVFACLLFLLPGGAAFAQSAITYSNTTTGNVNNIATPCTNVLVRNFTVSQTYTVADVDIATLITHGSRGDIQMVLQSPSGTRVQLIQNTGGTANNINVTFNDGAGTGIATHSAGDTNTAPPYQRNFQPLGSLSNFNGQNASGTWRLEVCDSLSNTNGTFNRADLLITPLGSDLSLTNVVSSTTPTAGATITYTLSLTASAGSQTSNNVTVADILPLGVTLVSASGYGTYNSGTGIWTVPDIAAGQTRTLTINATVNASSGASVTSYAQIQTAPNFDLDSTPGNDSTGEDDNASATFTVSGTRTAGTPPTLTCPANSSLLDWDTLTWTPQSLNNTYNITGIGNVNFSITNPGAWLNLAQIGGTQPRLSNTVTGGITPAQNSLTQGVNMASNSQLVSTVVTLPQAIPGVQFRVFDVDFGANQFADRVVVTGSRNGVPVTPVLTHGSVNYVVGNQAIGDGTSADTEANGNVVVTFSSPIDTFTIQYGNHTTAPSDPGQQAIAIHDITMCRPYADLSLTKAVSNAMPNAGASITYTLTATNASASTLTATGIQVRDTLPAGFTYASAAGTGTYTAGTGIWAVGSLAPGASATIALTGTVSAAQGATVVNVAEITASSALDSDSTVNNAVTTEDDYATVSFTVATISVLTAPTCGPVAANNVITNGGFTGTGPSGWAGWTAAAVWGGTGQADVSNDTVSGNLTQAGLSGLRYGPSASEGAVLQLSHWWRNGAPAASSASTQLSVILGGVTYANVTTPAAGPTSASVTYLNGASGNVSSFTEFNTTGWHINLPTSVAATGALTFAFTAGPGGSADDFTVDNVALYTCTPPDIEVTKTSVVWNSGSNPLYRLPGNDVAYTITVTNTASGQTTNNSVFLYDTMPPNVRFFNGDANGAAPGTAAVNFADSGSGLTWTIGTDLRYSDAGTPPANMAACTYTPAAGYDANVRYICFNPKGIMNRKTGAATPGFSLSFRALIE